MYHIAVTISTIPPNLIMLNYDKTFYLMLCPFTSEIKECSLMQDVVMKEWRDLARDLLCRTTLSSRHIIGTQEKHINIRNVNKATV
jgi:hypothetical protein